MSQEFSYPEHIQAQRGAAPETESTTTAQIQQDINPDTGRPRPRISADLQARIDAKLAQADVPAYSEEVVHPEHATKPVEPAPYTPRRDSETTSADLPSRFAFYDFKDLFIGKFKTRHYGKLHEAHVTKSLNYMLEAVSDIVHTSDPRFASKPLAFELTVPDYYWVLYYLRLNQIKTKLTHRTMCNNPEHIEAVHRGTKSQDSLKIVVSVDRSHIHTKVLGSVPDPADYDFEHFTLQPARMIDVLESLENPLFSESEEYRYLARVASLIRIKGEPDASFDDRIALIEDLDFDELARIGRYEAIVSSYGPEEFINVTCKECGHQRRTKVTLDARSFLPI